MRFLALLALGLALLVAGHPLSAQDDHLSSEVSNQNQDLEVQVEAEDEEADGSALVEHASVATFAAKKAKAKRPTPKAAKKAAKAANKVAKKAGKAANKVAKKAGKGAKKAGAGAAKKAAKAANKVAKKAGKGAAKKVGAAKKAGKKVAAKKVAAKKVAAKKVGAAKKVAAKKAGKLVKKASANKSSQKASAKKSGTTKASAKQAAAAKGSVGNIKGKALGLTGARSLGAGAFKSANFDVGSAKANMVDRSVGNAAKAPGAKAPAAGWKRDNLADRPERKAGKKNGLIDAGNHRTKSTTTVTGGKVGTKAAEPPKGFGKTGLGGSLTCAHKACGPAEKKQAAPMKAPEGGWGMQNNPLFQDAGNDNPLFEDL